MYIVNIKFDLNRSKKDFYGNMYMFNKQKKAQNPLKINPPNVLYFIVSVCKGWG